MKVGTSRDGTTGRVLGAALALVVAGCGGRTLAGGGSGDAGATRRDAADAARDGALRVPLRHRPGGGVCPRERAPATPTPPSACPPDGGVTPMLICDCTRDADCTAGPNGRCGQWIPPPVLACTYDACFVDADCDAGVPCDCRASSASSAPNTCRGGGNCAIDADCGPGGYCSPSVLDVFCACFTPELCPDGGGGCYETLPSGETIPVPCECGDKCGHGYFCHTAGDTCIDDRDCGGAGTCNYDVLHRRWDCSHAACPPMRGE